MSFQRMIDLARRHGVPVVVTDKEGKEPVVVLPFELYEALLEGGSPSSGVRKPTAIAGEPVIVPVRDGLTLDRISGSPKIQQEADLLAELSMEERFYIEPLDDLKNS